MTQEQTAVLKPRGENPIRFTTNIFKWLRLFIGGIRRIEALPVIVVLVILYGTFMVQAPDVFQSFRIYLSFLRTVSPPLILGLGLTLVIAAGEIDLSFPAVVAFSGYALTWGYENFADPLGPFVAPWAAVGLALAAGALIGITNGIMVAKFKIPSIMATLAAQFFWYGVTLVLAEGRTLRLENIRVNIIHEVFVRRIEGILPVEGRGSTGIPAQAFWAVAFAIILWLILNRHKFGESIMFIGDNPDVARVMGINVDMTLIKLFTLMGVISAFAGVILTLEVTVFYPNQGNGFLLLVMAAVFIGGTSIAGGHGSMVGTFFGAFIIISLEPGIVAMKINGYWVRLIEGGVLAGSVLLHVLIQEENVGAAFNRIRGWSKVIQRKRKEVSG